MPHITVDVNRQVGGAAADVADHRAHLAFGIGQHHLGGSQRVEHELDDFNPGSANGLPQIFDGSGGRRDDVRFHFQAVAVHANRLVDAILPVKRKAALNDVDDLTTAGNGHGTGRFKGALHIRNVHRIVMTRNRHHAAAVNR